MEIDILSDKVKQQLSSWFHRRDRSLYLPPSTFYYLNNGAYLATAFISETILSANATSVTFANIPQDFRTLMLVTQGRSSAAAENDNILMRLNNDSGANYDFQQLFGNSATPSATAARATITTQTGGLEGANSRGNNFAMGISFLPGYSVSGQEKVIITLTEFMGNVSTDADMFVILRALRWRNTNVVTSIVLVPGTGPNFVSGSRFQLYGIL